MRSESAPTGLVVCLEDVEIDELVGAVEVLVQEGFRNFTLPVGNPGFAEFVDIYSARASIGAHGLRNADDLARTVEVGATFALLDSPDPAAVAAAAEADLSVHAQAMTPSEIREVLAQPVSGAMLFPADVVGHVMATRLRTLGLVERVLPRGGLGAFAAGEWLKAGSRAACVDTTLLSDALHGGDLGALRDRCNSFIQVQKKHAPTS